MPIPLGTNGLMTLEGTDQVATVGNTRTLMAAVDSAITTTKALAESGAALALADATSAAEDLADDAYTDAVAHADAQDTLAEAYLINDAFTKYGALPAKVTTLETKTTTQNLGTTDLNTVTTPGVYGQNLGGNATLARNYPEASRRGTLVVEAVSSTITKQEYTATSVQVVYIRELNGATWSGWSVQSPGVSGVLTTQDLDTFKKASQWGQNTTGNATLARNYPVSARGLLTVSSVSGESTVTQTYLTGGGTKSLYSREFYASAWSPWVIIGGSGGGGSSTSATKLVGTALSLSGGDEILLTTADFGARLLLDYGVTIPRWRIHFRNFNLRDNIVYPGALNLMGFSIGEAETTEGKPTGRWAGGSILLQGAATTPANGDEWVSDWFTYSLLSHKKYMLSYGFTAAAGQQVHRGLGAIWTTSAGSSATHTNSYGSRSTQVAGDIWIECEVPAETKVLGVAGDSYAVGHSSTSPVHDSWLAIYCRTNKALPMFWACSGERMEGTTDTNAPKATRYDAMSRPDVVYYALGSNDINNGADLTIAQERFHDSLEVYRQHATENIVLIPVRPPEPGETDAPVRAAFNEWLEMELPGWGAIYKDLASPIKDIDGTLDPRWRSSPGNIHLSTPGYGRMATAL